jgi:hypothetical protein
MSKQFYWPGAINRIEPLNGVIFTLPTNKMLNFTRIDNSFMEKMFLAMWSCVQWQGDTSILDAHLLIIALEIGNSWIFHLSMFTHFVYRTPLPWNTQQKSESIVENNTNALCKISIAEGNLNHKISLNGVKNFNLGIWKNFGCV